MNTETQFLVKIFPIDNCITGVLQDETLKEAWPTALWMQQEVKEVIKKIASRASSPRQARSWARTADVVLNNVYDLQFEIKEDPTQYQKHTGLYYAVVSSILIYDMSKTKFGKILFESLLDGSYTIESIAVETNKKIKGSDHDQIFDDARSFVDLIYKTIV